MEDRSGIQPNKEYRCKEVGEHYISTMKCPYCRGAVELINEEKQCN